MIQLTIDGPSWASHMPEGTWVRGGASTAAMQNPDGKWVIA